MFAGWSYEAALEALDHQCMESLKTSYRPSTQCNFRSKAGIFIRFCQLYRLKPFPTTEWDLILSGYHVDTLITIKAEAIP